MSTTPTLKIYLGSTGREDGSARHEYALAEVKHAAPVSSKGRAILRLEFVADSEQPKDYRLPTLAEAEKNAQVINDAIHRAESLTLHLPFVIDADFSKGY